MTTLNKANRQLFLLVLTFLLSGCLETMPPLGTKRATNQNAVAQEKVVATSDRATAPAFKASQLETQSKPVVVRVNAQGSELQAANKPKPVAPKNIQKSSFSKGKEISCTPDVVRPGDTLVIKTSKSYPSLGVRVPDKNVKFILLVAGIYPEGLMDDAKFAKQMGIDINVAEAKVKPNTRVFTKEGIYGFVVSQNLETDDGTPSFECKVRYTTK